VLLVLLVLLVLPLVPPLVLTLALLLVGAVVGSLCAQFALPLIPGKWISILISVLAVWAGYRTHVKVRQEMRFAQSQVAPEEQTAAAAAAAAGGGGGGIRRRLRTMTKQWSSRTTATVLAVEQAAARASEVDQLVDEEGNGVDAESGVAVRPQDFYDSEKGGKRADAAAPHLEEAEAEEDAEASELKPKALRRVRSVVVDADGAAELEVETAAEEAVKHASPAGMSGDGTTALLGVTGKDGSAAAGGSGGAGAGAAGIGARAD